MARRKLRRRRGVEGKDRKVWAWHHGKSLLMYDTDSLEWTFISPLFLCYYLQLHLKNSPEPKYGETKMNLSHDGRSV